MSGNARSFSNFSRQRKKPVVKENHIRHSLAKTMSSSSFTTN